MLQSAIRVLYVDDDAALCRLVQKHLIQHGYEVECVPDGGSAIRRVCQGGIDAVALDHHMPEQDGLATLAALRQMNQQLPVIYVTAAQDGKIAIAALRAGAADYVVKDVHGEFLALLRAAIDTAVEAARMRCAKEAAEAEVRLARDKFKALAEERGMLLREVNHRISNSLQLIAVLLRMQGQQTTGHEAKAALSATESRVAAVARVHRRLYTSDDVRSVALDEYLRELIEDLRQSATSEGVTELLTLTAEPIEIDPDRAVAIGMIVTELVLNAIKHAYPDGSGPIRVTLRRHKDCSAILSVEDEGVGRKHAVNSSSKGLGRKILTAMAEKMRGSIDYDARDKGTRATLTFAIGSGAENAGAG